MAKSIIKKSSPFQGGSKGRYRGKRRGEEHEGEVAVKAPKGGILVSGEGDA